MGFNAAGLDTFGYMYKEAVELPNVKIILTLRDSAETWARSWQDTIGTHFELFTKRPFTFLKLFNDLRDYMRHLIFVVTNGDTQGFPYNFDALVNGYETHVKRVRDLVAEKNLVAQRRYLELNVASKTDSDAVKWEKLCGILEVEKGKCPSETNIAFPQVNDKTAMVALGYVLVCLTWSWPLIPLVVVVLISCIVRVCWGIMHSRSFLWKEQDRSQYQQYLEDGEVMYKLQS